MKIKYLKEAKTLQELKEIYFKLSKKYHPDLGGNDEIMKMINNEFDYLKEMLPNKKAKKGETIINENIKSMGKFKEIIEELLRYKNLEIEIVGSWLWVRGKGTFNIKDDVLYNKFNFKYSKPQKSFYWFDGIGNQKWKPRGGKLKEAKEKYEVITFKSEGMQAIA